MAHSGTTAFTANGEGHLVLILMMVFDVNTCPLGNRLTVIPVVATCSQQGTTFCC